MIRDALGRTFHFEHPPRRVVSLVPSITETLFDLGAGRSVVGVTDFCIFPKNLARQRLGGTKNPRIERIREVAPDLVHMNLEENLRRHAEAIEAFAPVFVSEPKSVEDVAALITSLGAIHDRAGDAQRCLADLGAEVAALMPRPFTFACAIWKDPWMWCGGDTYVSSLVETSGGTNVMRERTRYPTLLPAEVAAMRPQVIFLPDEPFVFTAEDAEEIRLRTAARVIGPFPGHLFTWHGTRTAKGLRFLRELAL